MLIVSLDPLATGHSSGQFADLYRQLLERTNALPGVRAASLSDVPFFGSGGARQRSISVQGYIPKRDDDLNPYVIGVSSRFFESMGIPVIAGRAFEPRDEAHAAETAIVNESFARYYFGAENPIGRRFGFGNAASSDRVEIVGPARDVKFNDLREQARHMVYTPISPDQFPTTTYSFVNTTLAVRVTGDPIRMAAQVRREI